VGGAAAGAAAAAAMRTDVKVAQAAVANVVVFRAWRRVIIMNFLSG